MQTGMYICTGREARSAAFDSLDVTEGTSSCSNVLDEALADELSRVQRNLCLLDRVVDKR